MFDVYDLVEDNIREINKYLCYVDQMSFKFATHHKVKLDFDSIIKKKLSQHVHNPDHFVKALQNNYCYISGSFLLACLYDEHHNNECHNNESHNHECHNDSIKINYSDIDIYEFTRSDGYNCSDYRPYNDLEKIEKYYYENGYKKYDSHIYNDIVYIIRQYVLSVDKKIPLQHILIRHNIKEFIDKSFDIDICKNMYNGNLQVYSWDNLIQRSSCIKPTWILISGYISNMIEDYEDDNEDIKGIDNIYFYKKNMKRINKYINRGFNIYLHKNFNQIGELFNKYKLTCCENNCVESPEKICICFEDGMHVFKEFIKSDFYQEYEKLL
jgi:hypothetical protein